MSYSVPYSFIPGTKARAQEVNANFNAVTDYLELLDGNKANNDLSNISAEGLNLIKNNSSRKNIGEIMYSFLPIKDANLHLLDGTLLHYGVYNEFIDYIADLYAEDQTANYFCTETEWQQSITDYGVCGKFVYNSENNTVRLPQITGKLDGTTDVSVLGDLEPLFVKLPNITGSLNNSAGDEVFYKNSATGTGAITPLNAWSSHRGTNSNGGNTTRGFSFDASLSSSVYSGDGTDTKIHEQAVKCFIYIVIATISKTEIQTDIDEIATDLNGKADVDLTNINDQAKIFMSGMGMPSGKYIDLTLGASAATYTAPANGYFYLRKISGGSGQMVWVHNNSAGHLSGANNFSTASGQYLSGSVPVKKGQQCGIEYSATGSTQFFRFIYTQGSESEIT